MGGVRGNASSSCFAQPRLVARVREQCSPLFLADRLVEQRAHLFQEPSSCPGPTDLLLPFAHLPQQVVEPTAARHAATEQVPQRLTRAQAVKDRVTKLVERAADVVRRGERVRPAAPFAVAVSAHYRDPYTLMFDRDP